MLFFFFLNLWQQVDYCMFLILPWYSLQENQKYCSFPQSDSVSSLPWFSIAEPVLRRLSLKHVICSYIFYRFHKHKPKACNLFWIERTGGCESEVQIPSTCYLLITFYFKRSFFLQKVPPNPLTEDIIAESLSLLCKTGDGLSHAYVRLDIHERYVQHVLR